MDKATRKRWPCLFPLPPLSGREEGLLFGEIFPCCGLGSDGGVSVGLDECVRGFGFAVPSERFGKLSEGVIGVDVSLSGFCR